MITVSSRLSTLLPLSYNCSPTNLRRRPQVMAPTEYPTGHGHWSHHSEWRQSEHTRGDVFSRLAQSLTSSCYSQIQLRRPLQQRPRLARVPRSQPLPPALRLRRRGRDHLQRPSPRLHRPRLHHPRPLRRRPDRLLPRRHRPHRHQPDQRRRHHHHHAALRPPRRRKRHLLRRQHQRGPVLPRAPPRDADPPRRPPVLPRRPHRAAGPRAAPLRLLRRRPDALAAARLHGPPRVAARLGRRAGQRSGRRRPEAAVR